MKIYVVYFRTMQDSPDVEIRCVTTNKEIADAKFEEAKREEAEWMADEEEDSGNWAEACLEEFEKGDGSVKPGDKVYVIFETDWVEGVETTATLFIYKKFIDGFIDVRKSQLLNEDPHLEPYDEDETLEESMHLCNPDVMSDYYFSIEPVIVE